MRSKFRLIVIFFGFFFVSNVHAELTATFKGATAGHAFVEEYTLPPKTFQDVFGSVFKKLTEEVLAKLS